MRPLLLLPGLGATGRLHAGLRRRIPAVIAADWPDDPGWSTVGDLAEVCIRRFALRPGDAVGGSSFGGMVAAEMARRLPGSALVLIGSTLDPSAIPARVLLGIPARMAGPRVLALAAWSSPGPITAMARGCGAPFIRRACSALRWWRGILRADLGTVHHIHGGRDLVIPASLVTADRLVGSAGHAIAWTHPGPVADFIRERMRHG